MFVVTPVYILFLPILLLLDGMAALMADKMGTWALAVAKLPRHTGNTRNTLAERGTSRLVLRRFKIYY
jgi:hypothetical protein